MDLIVSYDITASGRTSKASLSGGMASGRATPRRTSATPSRLSGLRSPGQGSDQGGLFGVFAVTVL